MQWQLSFQHCSGRKQEVHVPREVVWLNGAPGSGKGANTHHIMKTRGLEATFSMSGLLAASREARSLIDRGDMIPDVLVGDLLLETLLTKCCHAPECGVLVDGFPRTNIQVRVLSLSLCMSG
jgi:adenylate kinase